MKKKPFFYPVARILCLGFLKIFYPYEVKNGNSLPEDGKMVVCCNHQHNIDPIFLDATQNRLLFYMAKSELFKFKPFAHLISKYGAFPVYRGKDGGRAIHKGEELLRDNNCVGVFIEGTRSKTGEFLRPHTGALVLAYETDTPILPCCITGKKGIVKAFHKSKISYGKPVTCSELGITKGTIQEYRAAAAKVMSLIAELREEHKREFEQER